MIKHNLKNKFPYQRGARWRRWDLHVHTPASYDYKYGGQDGYAKVAKMMIKSDPCAFAITDHFSLEGYKELKKNEYQIKKRIFPGIELRLKDSILPSRQGGGKDTKSDTPINVQLIFDDTVDIFPKIEEFVSSLEFEDFNNVSCNLTRENIIKLGRQEDKTADDPKAYEIGCKKIRIPESQITDRIKKKGLSEKVLIVLPYEKYGGIGNIDPENDSLIKARLTKFAHIMESSRQEQIDFFLGNSTKLPCVNKNGKKNQKFLTYIGRPKPCVNGSDAHNPDKIGTFINDKACWIKSNPTFEGLRQVVFEPANRIYIGKNPPSKIDPEKTIGSITITNSNGWFTSEKILLNNDLVSVIGGKGSGKTALLDTISLAANKNWDELDGNDSSFLKKIKPRLPNLGGEIEWANGSKDSFDFRDKTTLVAKQDKVIYLSQGFVSTLCSEDGIDDLQKQIESVLFHKIEQTERSIYSDFRSYKRSKFQQVDLQKENIQIDIGVIAEEIGRKHFLIEEEENTRKELLQKENDDKKIKGEIKNLSGKLVKADNKKKFKEYQNLTKQKSDLEKDIAKSKERVRDMDVVSEEILNFRKKSAEFAKQTSVRLEKLGVKTKFSILLNPDNIVEVVGRSKTYAESQIKVDNKKLKELEPKIEQIVKDLQLEKTLQERIQELNKLEKQTNDSIASLKKKIENIDDAKTTINNSLDGLNSLFLRFFNVLRSERRLLEDIYKPLVIHLKQSGEENERLFSFAVDARFEEESMASTIYQVLDRRAEGNYRNIAETKIAEDLATQWGQLMDDYNWGPYKNKQAQETADKHNNQLLKTFISNIRSTFLDNQSSEEATEEHRINSQLKEHSSISDFYKWLFNTRYYSLNYSVSFNEKDLENLSPGLKGVALLILYLELDDEDLKPIIIDQPEENLDNRFVYTTLVRYFRKARQKRQVVIATHNANLVVNTDSEQVIVANYDKDKSSQKTTISYVSESLENSFEDTSDKNILTSRGIRQHCWDVLEGGPEAFKEREEKYNFPK